ncbi:MAG: hypothetical protein H0U39_00515 [Segetibacter sp.]|nr:hypothetical protein [Segetibacter sp.]
MKAATRIKCFGYFSSNHIHGNFPGYALGDVFNFLIAHNHRHVLQVERALKSVTENEAETTESSNLRVRGIYV